MRYRPGRVSALVAAALVSALLFLPAPKGRAAQSTLALPTTGVFNGLTEQNNINAALNALNTCNSGSAAPTNALGGAPVEGQCWLDTTSSTLKILKRYTGSGWAVEGVLDVTNGIWSPPVGGGTASVASAATTNLCASPQAVQTVTGTTNITSFGSSCVAGQRKTLIFSGAALTLTYNATSMIIPGSNSLNIGAGDVLEAVYLGSGNWRVVSYAPLIGTVVNSIAGRTGLLSLSHGLTNSANDLQIDVSSLANYIGGLTLSTGTSSSTFTIAAGAATDSTNADFMKLASALNKNTTAWAVGFNLGALDTGSIAASTWYHVFIIKRPDTGVVDACISASVTGCAAGVANIPAAYTLKRRIGSMKTDVASNWIKFFQVGDEFFWDQVSTVDASTSGTTPAAAYALNVPPGVSVLARGATTLRSTSAGANVNIFSGLAGTQASAAANVIISAPVANVDVSGQFAAVTNTSRQIQASSNGSAPSPGAPRRPAGAIFSAGDLSLSHWRPPQWCRRPMPR